jgi:hypothetical protein
MQTILEHAPHASRRNSNSSERSHDSGFSASSVDMHHGKTSGASTSGAPFGANGKPHTLSDIAHRAIGDHVPDHAHHSTAGNKYNKRELSGEDQDPTVVGGEHPGLDRSAGSGRFSKGMPNTPWTNTKAEEIRKEQNGENEEPSPEEKKDKKVAGEKMRHVMGVAVDAGHNLKDNENRETKEQRNEKETREAVERLSLHAERNALGCEDKGTDGATPLNNGDATISQARKQQEKFFHTDKMTSRQGDPEFVSDQASQEHDDSRRQSNSNGRQNHANNDQKVNGDAVNGFRHSISEHEDPSTKSSNGDENDRERLPDRNPKENVHGQVPEAMAPTKKETAPGSQNEINLRPRVPDMQVSPLCV